MINGEYFIGNLLEDLAKANRRYCSYFFRNKKRLAKQVFFNQRRPTLPGSLPPSTISAEELNYCVRDGNRCILFAIVTGFSSRVSYPQNFTM